MPWYESSAFWGLFGVLVGTFVTIFVSRHYAVRSTKQMDAVATELKSQVGLLTRWADNFAGSPKFAKDESGLPRGIVHELKGSISGGGEFKANLAPSNTDAP